MMRRLLAFLRVPEQPDPPPGAGDELATFRASRGFFYYSVLLWLPKQVGAVAGLMFSLAFVGGLHSWGLAKMETDEAREVLAKIGEVNQLAAWLGSNLVNIITFFEILAIVIFVGQLVFTGLLLRASWELRWYMVGERALRIRYGLWTVQEQTMTIANIQNMTIRQGPLQRLFGFSDLEVSTAGGGGQSVSGDDSIDKKDSFHVGRFRGLENAPALRDQLRRRLQEVQGGESEATKGREASADRPAVAAAVAAPSDLANAARELLAEARGLRQAIG